MSRTQHRLTEVKRSLRSGGSNPAPPESRLPRLIGCNPLSLERLRRLTVVVVGTGSVGGVLTIQLARLAVLALILIDPKRFKPESLITHDAHPRDIGKPKAEVTARRCKDISPTTRVRYFNGPVEALDLTELAQADLVVMAPDRVEVEVEMAQRCMSLGLPLIQASVHGESLVAQVRLYRNSNAQGCCAGCFLGESEWNQLAQQPVRYSCEQAAHTPAVSADNPASTIDGPVTSSFSSLCSIAANLTVIEIIRLFTGAGKPLTESMLEYCGFTHRTIVSELARNPKCRLDHFQYRRVDSPLPLGQQSLAELTGGAQLSDPNANPVYEINGMDWVELGSCQCKQPQAVRRFVPRDQPLKRRCRQCGTPVTPLQFYTHRRVSGELLQSALEKPLHKLGAERAQQLFVRAGESGALISHKPTREA